MTDGLFSLLNTTNLLAIRQGMLFNLEKESLLASGLKEDHQVREYGGKLDQLTRQFLDQTKPLQRPVEKASALFQWLWERKPDRYQLQGRFRLTDVIDAELRKDSRTVGNCLGLTLLYNSLLRRMGVHTDALYLDHAFGIGPHILTLLPVGKSTIDIENILPDGFDYQGHLNHPSRTKWGDKELVADIYHSRANECFEKKGFAEALKNYEMAIKLNPQYEKAHLNRAILIDKLGKRDKDR